MHTERQTLLGRTSTMFLVVFLVFPSLVFAEVKVGVIIPYSGAFAQYGEVIRGGVERGKEQTCRQSMKMRSASRCQLCRRFRNYRQSMK